MKDEDRLGEKREIFSFAQAREEQNLLFKVLLKFGEISRRKQGHAMK
jgi:hypothetical protein